MTKQEIEKEILKEALNYLKNRKAYDENPCIKTSRTHAEMCIMQEAAGREREVRHKDLPLGSIVTQNFI